MITYPALYGLYQSHVYNIFIYIYLVGGLEHFLFFIIYGNNNPK
jgi:glycine cleavage system protein P-like pyridoxal-binding family